MNKEIKAKWIEALRSGKYIQVRNALRDRHGFCCLGVLCDILPTLKYESFGYVDSTDTVAEPTLLTGQIRKETGLEKENLRYCVEMNDTQRKSFEEIAAWIEAAL